jgi:hypothetical protein
VLRTPAVCSDAVMTRISEAISTLLDLDSTMSSPPPDFYELFNSTIDLVQSRYALCNKKYTMSSDVV